jgi:hypothetical protein
MASLVLILEPKFVKDMDSMTVTQYLLLVYTQGGILVQALGYFGLGGYIIGIMDLKDEVCLFVAF